MNTCGIYKIVNKLNGKFYIGSSNKIDKRYLSHMAYLRRNKHCNQHLQAAWNKYGKDNFYLEVYRECDVNVLKEEEQKELDIWVGNDLCYNMNKNADRPVGVGEKRPQWIVDKIRKSNTGKRRTEEQNKQMSFIKTGIKFSPETIGKMKNRKSSYINIKKAYTFNIDRKYSKSHCENISKAKRDRHIKFSDEIKDRIRDGVIKSISMDGTIHRKGHCKIPKSEYEQIKKLYVIDGLTTKKLAQTYSVGYKYIWKLLKKIGVK